MLIPRKSLKLTFKPLFPPPSLSLRRRLHFLSDCGGGLLRQATFLLPIFLLLLLLLLLLIPFHLATKNALSSAPVQCPLYSSLQLGATRFGLVR